MSACFLSGLTLEHDTIREASGNDSLMFNTMYVCPVACHRDVSERLLLKGLEGSWFLWMGDEAVMEPIEVPRRFAGWIARRPEMKVLAHPVMWFDVSSLPVTSVSAGQGRQAGHSML